MNGFFIDSDVEMAAKDYGAKCHPEKREIAEAGFFACWKWFKATPSGSRLVNELQGMGAMKWVKDVEYYIGGWREIIGLLEDYCNEPVALKTMRASLNQIDKVVEQMRNEPTSTQADKEDWLNGRDGLPPTGIYHALYNGDHVLFKVNDNGFTITRSSGEIDDSPKLNLIKYSNQ